MRIKINGTDVDSQSITIETKQFSNAAAWLVIVVGTISAIIWYFAWV